LSAFFQINDSFHITGRGLVAAGDILSGTIKVGDIAGQKYNLKILGVEIGDRLSEEEHFAGLVFKSDSVINLAGVKLNSQVIEINRPYDRS
jgi:hypothetical protein